jgi:hypothetical protein
MNFPELLEFLQKSFIISYKINILERKLVQCFHTYQSSEQKAFSFDASIK